MLKFVIGVAVGAIFRDALIQLYKRNAFPYQDRITAMYMVGRYGAEEIVIKDKAERAYR